MGERKGKSESSLREQANGGSILKIEKDLEEITHNEQGHFFTPYFIIVQVLINQRLIQGETSPYDRNHKTFIPNLKRI